MFQSSRSICSLFRYFDEEAFRYNNRLPMNDADRFSYLVRKIVGKRLTYKELIGEGGANEGSFPARKPDGRGGGRRLRLWTPPLRIEFRLALVFSFALHDNGMRHRYYLVNERVETLPALPALRLFC